MKNQVLNDYLLYLAPAFVIPAFVYLLDNSISPQNLVKMGLLVPLFALAMKGVGGFFPPENLVHRSTSRMAENAVLQGLVFGAFMLFIRDLLEPEMHSDLSIMFRQFAVTTILMSGVNFALAFSARKKLQSANSSK